MKFKIEDDEATVNLLISYIQKSNSRRQKEAQFFKKQYTRDEISKLDKRKLTQSPQMSLNMKSQTPQRLSNKFKTREVAQNSRLPALPSLNNSKRKISRSKSKSPKKSGTMKKRKFKILKKILKKNLKKQPKCEVMKLKPPEASLKEKQAIIADKKKLFAATRNQEYTKHERGFSMSTAPSPKHNYNLYSFQPNYPKSNFCDSVAKILKRKNNQRLMQIRKDWSEAGFMPKIV
ncbi:unnamed protein product [Moneuplotes crassus]|uniref:Uncharacterized protein n=1 Tax=Euplotes crassus TaxID=5936 RepID=A0AAD1UB64_EUPCR|nr:unnamed protein product [Moneuplotes crassus]